MRGWRHWPAASASQCGELLRGIRDWLLVPEHLQSLGTALVYIQVGCGLAGSLSEFYCGVPVAELAIALFGLVAIESGIQLLLRLYLILMLGCILLDVFWFVLVASELRSLANSGTLAMMYIFVGLQGTGSVFRLLSAFVWIPLIRYGFSATDAASYQPVDFEARLPTIGGAAPPSECFWQEESGAAPSSSGTLAGSIYDPVYFSSLFEDTKDGGHQLRLDCAG